MKRLPWFWMLLCGWAAAQQTAPYLFHATNRGDVLLHVTVLDGKKHNVAHLTQADFSVSEDGRPQSIAWFAEEDAPVSVGLLVDNSGSMRDKQAKVKEAALDFVGSSNSQDEVFVLNFNDEIQQGCGFTNQIPILRQALTVKAAAATALYDALTQGLAFEAADAKNDKRVLLVITDGYDNASRHGLDETLKLAQAPNGPLVYGIGLLDPTDIPEEHKQGEKILKRFAETTGGTAYFPASLDQVNAMTREIAAEIRAQYTIIYHSDQIAAGYHSIRVTAGKNGNLQARTRAGYYAGN